MLSFILQGIGFKSGGDMHEPNIEVVLFQLIFILCLFKITYEPCWYI